MKNTVALAVSAFLLLGPLPSIAAVPTVSKSPASDQEMKQIYDADQADRSADITKIDWTVIGPRDAQRRQQVRRLLAAGRLHTGADFREAALVFQHGEGDDFMLAHTLAVIATKKGDAGGPWIAAATLDRYLQSVGRKQIYGTQMSTSINGWTREPYDRDLISDALRRELGVPDLASQAQQLALRKAQGAPPVVVVSTETPQASAKADIKCDAGPLARVFVRATWQIFSCDNGGLLVVGEGQSPTTIWVTTVGGKVVATAPGSSDDAEVTVAKAAMQAMSLDQIAYIITQTKALKP